MLPGVRLASRRAACIEQDLQGRKKLRIYRKRKSEAIQYENRPGYRAKPMAVKLKSQSAGGIIDPKTKRISEEHYRPVGAALRQPLLHHAAAVRFAWGVAARRSSIAAVDSSRHLVPQPPVVAAPPQCGRRHFGLALCKRRLDVHPDLVVELNSDVTVPRVERPPPPRASRCLCRNGAARDAPPREGAHSLR
jgi:hypothetical protein